MLALRAAVYDAVLAHAREATPEEACGILAGDRENAESEDGDSLRATAIDYYRTPNVAAEPTITYEIDPETQYRVLEEIDDSGRDLVGFFHSHPQGPAGPSATDHRQAAWPGYHYLIASLGGDRPVLDAWRWDGERFVRDPVGITPPSLE